MFPGLSRQPAAILFIGITLGLASSPHLISSDLAVLGASVSTLLALGFRGDARLPTCLLFAALATGLIIAERTESRHAQTRSIIAALPDDRFARVRATIDDEWKPGRDGVFSVVRGFEIVTESGLVVIDERLSVYAPSDVPVLGEYDYIEAEGFLRESRRGSLYLSVKSRRLVALSHSRGPWHPRSWNRALRGSLSRHVSVFPEHERACALIRAIALGDGSALSSELRDSYRRGGTYHLLVFSGMQIAFAAAMIAFLLRLLRLHVATDLSLVLLAVVAPLFAGSEPSVGRAATMIGVYGMSRLLGRPTPMSNLLFLSAAIRLLGRPEELTSPGFLLTYAATFGLVVVGRTLASATHHPVAKAIAYGIGAELCTQPLTLLFFRHFVAGGFAVTMMLSPLLGGILLLSIPIAVALAAGSDVAWFLVELVSRLDLIAVALNDGWSGLKLSGFAPAPPPTVVVGSFATAWIISWRGIVGLHKGVLMAAALLVVPGTVAVQSHLAQDDQPSIEFLDVGQGDATLIRATKTILVDGGGSASDPEFGRRSLIPLLADRGVQSLDVVVMSHPDIDHCGGLLSLVRSIHVSELWMSVRHLGAPCTGDLLAGLSPDTRLRFLRDGQVIAVGDAQIEVTVPRLRFKRNPLNNSSVVLTVQIAGTRAILAGDLERDAETMIADEAGERLRGDLLKVAHHGSRTSTTPEFLTAVRPRTAIVSCGRDNLYGHPAPEVVERLRNHPAQVLRTDLSGSIRFDITQRCLSLRLPANQSVKLTRTGSCF